MSNCLDELVSSILMDIMNPGGTVDMGARDSVYLPQDRATTKQRPLFEELEDGNLILYEDEV